MPLVGEQVTDTEQPGGRWGIWSCSDFSGTTSYRAFCDQAAAGIMRTHRATPACGESTNSVNSSAMASSIGGISYSARRFFQTALARVRCIGCTVFCPLLEAGVVGDVAAIERGLEIGERVGSTQEVLPGSVVADGVDGLAVLRQIESLDERGHHPALVLVHDELLVADRQPALLPSGGVQHEVGARRARSAAMLQRSRRRPARRGSSTLQ